MAFKMGSVIRILISSPDFLTQEIGGNCNHTRTRLGGQENEEGGMGKCPERASPSPLAAVGTSPYHLLNGTAGGPPPMGIQSPRFPLAPS
jgi:hypothetical protein